MRSILRRELELMRGVVVTMAERVFNERKAQVEYLVGTMIELPRAALTADEIGYAVGFNTATIKKDTIKSPEEALIEIYRRMRPGDPPTLDSSKNLFDGSRIDGRCARRRQARENAEYHRAAAARACRVR